MRSVFCLVGSVSLACFAAACGDSGTNSDGGTGGTGGDGGTQAVTVNFQALVGTETAECGGTYTLGTEDTEVTLNDLRFFVSNVRLVNDEDEEVAVTLDQETPEGDDNPWIDGDIALLDFEDGCVSGTAAMNSQVKGTVPTGTYGGIVFDLSIPFEDNHQDPLEQPSPLNVPGMFWNWAGGHKFIRIDLSGDIGWNFHLGSTMCDSSAPPDTPPATGCTKPNRPSIALSPFSYTSDIVTLDLLPLFGDSDLTSSSEPASGCQSFPGDEDDCLTLFPNVGLDYFTGNCVDGCSAQSVFTAE